MIKTLTRAQKMEREKFRIPRSVQDAIPIRRIFADGIFQVGNRYLPYIRNGYKGTPPTLQDFYRLLQMQPEPEAQGLALSSELFITGTLNTFARHTNVDTQARIIAYDIRELGEQLMPLGMLVTLDAIYNRVIQNWKKGRRTWIFCDEFYRARRSVT